MRPQGKHRGWLALLTMAIAVSVAVSALAWAGEAPDKVVLPPLEPQRNSIYYIPQIANGYLSGLSITSRISLSNLRESDGVATISFLHSDGTAWGVPLDCPQDVSVSGEYTSLPLVLEAGKSRTIETLGVGPLGAGWAKVEANCPLLVTATYTVFVVEAVPAAIIQGGVPKIVGPPPMARERPLWEASVPQAPCGTKLSLNPVVGPDSVMGGVTNDASIAIANPSDQTAHVTAQIFSASGGAALGQNSLDIPPLGHHPAYITELFPGVSFSQYTQLTVRLSCNVNITAVALQRLLGNGADINASLSVQPDSSMMRTIQYDTESNGDRAHAQPIIPTCEIIGTQNEPDDSGDWDYFSVYLHANETLYATVLTESIGSGAKPVLRLDNSSGITVASALSLAAGLDDAMLSYKSPVNATYYVKLSTGSGTYGRNSFYRIFVRVE